MLNALNKRVVGRVGQCSLFESSDSNVWAVCFRRNPSDSAAHANHYTKWKLTISKNAGIQTNGV